MWSTSDAIFQFDLWLRRLKKIDDWLVTPVCLSAKADSVSTFSSCRAAARIDSYYPNYNEWVEWCAGCIIRFGLSTAYCPKTRVHPHQSVFMKNIPNCTLYYMVKVLLIWLCSVKVLIRNHNQTWKNSNFSLQTHLQREVFSYLWN